MGLRPRANFIPAFFCTVYKYQGADISEHYNIYDVNQMDKKQLYTSLSRTTKFEYTHLNNESLNKRCVPRQQSRLELLNNHFNSGYHNNQIHEILFEQCDNLYIGSTCQELEARLQNHVTDKRSAVYMYRNNEPKISLIERVPSKDRKSLEKVENEYIHEYATEYGDRPLNKKSVPQKDKKEIQFKAQIENETQLREKLAKLGVTLRIKQFLYYRGPVDGKEYKSIAAYKQRSKEEAMSGLTKKQ